MTQQSQGIKGGQGDKETRGQGEGERGRLGDKVTNGRHGLPRPRFEEVGSEFRVTLMGPGKRFMEEVTVQPAWAEGSNERQVEAMLYVGEHGRITTAEYRDLVGVSDVTAYRDLGICVRKSRWFGTAGGEVPIMP